MPSCKSCQKSFPNRLKIGEKVYLLSSRKLCLDCSPFKAPFVTDRPVRVLQCTMCNKLWNYICGNGGTTKICKTCVSRQRRMEGRERAYDYKGGECLVCSYQACKEALQFHHMNSELKLFQIGDNVNRKWEILSMELDKCVLICSNCHAELHAGLINNTELIELEQKRVDGKHKRGV